MYRADLTAFPVTQVKYYVAVRQIVVCPVSHENEDWLAAKLRGRDVATMRMRMPSDSGGVLSSWAVRGASVHWSDDRGRQGVY